MGFIYMIKSLAISLSWVGRGLKRGMMVAKI
jgi:hypothetical protein